MDFAKPVKKEILSFFNYRNLLKILKYNLEFRKEFYLDKSKIDQFFNLNDDKDNEELYIKTIYDYKIVLILYIEVLQYNKEIKIISREDIFEPQKTNIYINGKKDEFKIKYTFNKGTYKILISTNEDLPNNLSKMFYKLNNLKSIKFIKFESSNVLDMSWMFSICINLSKLDLNIFKTDKVTNMSYMFCRCQNLSSLDIRNFNTKNVNDISWMFYDCISLKSIDLSKFDTSQVTNFSFLFYNCHSLTSIDLSNFNTNKASNMCYMFYECNNLSFIDINKFNLNLVNNMSYMFFNCSSLSLDISKFKTKKINNTKNMFYGCNFEKFINNEIKNEK